MYNMGYMAYTNNPNISKVRVQAVRLVRKGWSTREVARHIGFAQGTIVKWTQRAPDDLRHGIPTKSSRPYTHPNSLKSEIVNRIIKIRGERGRCAEVVHQTMLKEGYSVSVASVQRTLDRQGLTRKRSPWKKYHPPSERPHAFNPGDLVEIDTIHSFIYTSSVKFFVYTLIDVYSRWAWADVVKRISASGSIRFVKDSHRNAPFRFHVLQSDHGPEFSTHFSENVRIDHRHTHVRSPNENGHIERFNRTIQEECFRGVSRNPDAYRKALPEYLHYYNHERMHMGIDFKKPIELT